MSIGDCCFMISNEFELNLYSMLGSILNEFCMILDDDYIILIRFLYDLYMILDDVYIQFI